MKSKINSLKNIVADKLDLLRLYCIKYTQEFAEDIEGIGVVEVILILVVLIGLVLIFKDQLNSLVESIFQKIKDESNNV